MMKPKKNLVEAARKNGSITRLNMLLSAAQLLTCEANALIEESSDLMKDNGLNLGMIKKLHNDFVKTADRYFTEFADHIFTKEDGMDMFADLEAFDKAFRKWAKVPADWEIGTDPLEHCKTD